MWASFCQSPSPQIIILQIAIGLGVSETITRPVRPSFVKPTLVHEQSQVVDLTCAIQKSLLYCKSLFCIGPIWSGMPEKGSNMPTKNAKITTDIVP
jgi:hypothetical protein